MPRSPPLLQDQEGTPNQRDNLKNTTNTSKHSGGGGGGGGRGRGEERRGEERRGGEGGEGEERRGGRGRGEDEERGGRGEERERRGEERRGEERRRTDIRVKLAVVCRGERFRDVHQLQRGYSACQTQEKVSRLECRGSCPEGAEGGGGIGCCTPLRSKRRKYTFHCTDGSSFVQEVEKVVIE
ncbi:unnamed protein product [Coregonus sp. 'balchen']|nr:unnamed protein product [Coregonus sp. 'balchen']